MCELDTEYCQKFTAPNSIIPYLGKGVYDLGFTISYKNFMEKYYTIKVDQLNYELFKDFSRDNPKLMWEFKSDYFTGSELVHDFIVTIGPATLTALSSYIIAKIPKENDYIKFKKGEKEVELKLKSISNENIERILEFLKEEDYNNEE